jgi:hypothetical protein
MPAEMEEVIGRLEKGEDPDKLEEEFGDVFEGMDEAGGMDAGGSDEGTKTKARRPKRVTRDPKLYEMGEFCE